MDDNSAREVEVAAKMAAMKLAEAKERQMDLEFEEAQQKEREDAAAKRLAREKKVGRVRTEREKVVFSRMNGGMGE